MLGRSLTQQPSRNPSKISSKAPLSHLASVRSTVRGRRSVQIPSETVKRQGSQKEAAGREPLVSPSAQRHEAAHGRVSGLSKAGSKRPAKSVSLAEITEVSLADLAEEPVRQPTAAVERPDSAAGEKEASRPSSRHAAVAMGPELRTSSITAAAAPASAAAQQLPEDSSQITLSSQEPSMADLPNLPYQVKVPPGMVLSASRKHLITIEKQQEQEKQKELQAAQAEADGKPRIVRTTSQMLKDMPPPVAPRGWPQLVPST